jgi:ferrous iron transport protein A
VRVSGAPELRRRLLEMGLCNGVRVVVVRHAPLGDPIEFHLRGYNLSLRREQARHVEVMPEEG